MKIKLFILCLFLQIASCNPIDSNYDNLNNNTEFEKECIADFYDFSFSSLNTGPEMPTPIPPMSPWKEIYNFQNSNDWVYYISGYRHSNKTSEIWIGRVKFDSKEIKTYRNFIIFNTENYEMQIIPAEINKSGIYVDEILISPNGEVWGVNRWIPMGRHPIEDIPIFSKYNQEKRAFEFVEGIFTISIVDDNINFNDWVDALIDNKGNIWFFMPFDGLYYFNTEKSEVELKAPITDYKIWQSIIDINNNIYFRKMADDIAATSKIYQYSIEREKLGIYIEINNEWPQSGKMLVDRFGNLWIGAVGTINPLKQEKLIFPGVLQRIENFNNQNTKNWKSPNVVFESSDGVIWFEKYWEVDNGIAWFNPTTGEGCMFTNLVTINHLPNIIEDNSGAIWLIVDNKLFKK